MGNSWESSLSNARRASMMHEPSSASGGMGPPGVSISPDQPPQVRESVPASALPRRRFFNEMPDKGLFAFVSVFGFVLIVWLKIRGYDGDLVAGLAVIFML